MTDDQHIVSDALADASPDDRPLIDPETGWHLGALDEIVMTIRLVDSMKPWTWSINSHSDSVILNIGNMTFIRAYPDGSVYFVLDQNAMSDENHDAFPGIETGGPFDSNPSLFWAHVGRDQVDDALQHFRESHQRAAAGNIGYWKINQRWRWHKTEVVEKIARITGLEIPEPGYAEQLRELRRSSTEASSSSSLTIEHKHGRRYWRFWSGKDGKNRKRFLDEAFVGLDTWSSSRVDLSALPDDREDFVRAITAFEGYGRPGAAYPWRLRSEMKLDDYVALQSSDNTIHWGRVSGDYQYGEDGVQPMHRRPIEWLGEVDRPSARMPKDVTEALDVWDPTPLTARQFAILLGADLQGDSEKQDITTDNDIVPFMVLLSLQEHVAARGLAYSKEQIATFYTALQTKGFVVLSGISGTGKSKIAQHFVELMPNPVAEPLETTRDEGVISFTLKPYSKKYKRVILPVRQVDVLPAVPLGSSRDVRVTFGGEVDVCRIENRAQASGRPLHVLYFRGEISKAIQAVAIDTRMYLRPIFDDDGDKLRQLDLLTDVPVADSPVSPSTQEVANHLFLSVRPDWRDSTSLLGYFNPLTERYQWTDFLHFLLRAVRSYEQKDGLAWFVILDEMNLAHVEYYFADLLSVIESGRQGTTDTHPGFSREPLRITYGETVDDDVPPREVFLPPNLYIIGTVNMDETTHAFSPKVLDRAFTIELTEVDFTNFPPILPDTAPIVADETKWAMLAAFTRNDAFHEIDKREIAAIVTTYPAIRDRLQLLNKALERDRFQFGYRIFDEICQYLANNEANGMATFDEAFDAAVYMKVLPKFTGSEARLRSPLRSLFAWAVNPDAPAPIDPNANADALNLLVDGAKVPKVARRVHQMIRTLETDGFVSFG